MVEVQDRNKALPKPRRTKARWAALGILLHLLAEGGAVYYALQLSRTPEASQNMETVMPIHFMSAAPPSPIRSISLISRDRLVLNGWESGANAFQFGDTLYQTVPGKREIKTWSLSAGYLDTWTVPKSEGLLNDLGFGAWSKDWLVESQQTRFVKPLTAFSLPDGYVAWMAEGVSGIVILDKDARPTAGKQGQHLVGDRKGGKRDMDNVKLKVVSLPEKPTMIVLHGDYLLAYGQEASVYIISCKGTPEKWQNIATIRTVARVVALKVSESGMIYVATEGSKSLSTWQLPGLNRKAPVALPEPALDFLLQEDTIIALGNRGLYKIQASNGKRLAGRKLSSNAYRRLNWVQDKSAVFLETYAPPSAQPPEQQRGQGALSALEIRALKSFRSVWREYFSRTPALTYFQKIASGDADTLLIQFEGVNAPQTSRLLLQR